MDAVIVVEVLGRRAQVQQRVRVERLPFLIGRGYACDLILDDRYVCPEHARLERDADGALALRDLGSKNGLYELGSGRRVETLTLTGDDEVRLGRTHLRLRTADHVVEPALVVPSRPGWLQPLTSSASAAVVGVVAVLASAAWHSWRRTYVELEVQDVLQNLLILLLALLAWSGVWALLGRLLVHSHRFAAHCAAACVYWLGFALFAGALDYARFLVSPIAGLLRLQYAGEAALLGALVGVHLKLATGLGRRACGLAAVGVLLVAWARSELENRREPDFWVSTLPYWSQLEPLDAGWLPTESSEEFFSGASALDAELGALVDAAHARARERKAD